MSAPPPLEPDLADIHLNLPALAAKLLDTPPQRGRVTYQRLAAELGCDPEEFLAAEQIVGSPIWLAESSGRYLVAAHPLPVVLPGVLDDGSDLNLGRFLIRFPLYFWGGKHGLYGRPGRPAAANPSLGVYQPDTAHYHTSSAGSFMHPHVARHGPGWNSVCLHIPTQQAFGTALFHRRISDMFAIAVDFLHTVNPDWLTRGHRRISFYGNFDPRWWKHTSAMKACFTCGCFFPDSLGHPHTAYERRFDYRNCPDCHIKLTTPDPRNANPTSLQTPPQVTHTDTTQLVTPTQDVHIETPTFILHYTPTPQPPQTGQAPQA